MSRIAKNPVLLPAGIDVKLEDGGLTVKGSKGTLVMSVHHNVEVKHDDKVLTFAAKNPADKKAVALAGTTRSLVSNMVTGVNQGFERKLILNGVGYRAKAAGRALNMVLGYSHDINYEVPEGVTVETPTQTEILLKGIDKQLLGEVAAKIRAFRPPEPYKGKGVRYADEIVRIKEAKKK
jgi:large subunit ribosomal protein L6